MISPIFHKVLSCAGNQDCTGLSDTCTSERCTCGINPICSKITSDTCDSGTCRCGLNGECEEGMSCKSGVCKSM